MCGAIWRFTRRRAQSVCLLLAFLSVLLHLLLVFLTLSTYQPPCEPQSHLPRKTIRDLIQPHTNQSEDVHRRNPDTGASGPAQSVGALRDKPAPLLKPDATVKQQQQQQQQQPVGGAPLNPRVGSTSGPMLPAEAEGGLLLQPQPQPQPNLTMLEALWSHPLYNLPSPVLEEDDWLLRFKPKVKENELDSPQWVSAEGYDPVHINGDVETHPAWLRFHLAITRWQLYDRADPNLLLLEDQLASDKIVSAVQKTGGTQLKLVMSFPNYGQALFKPMKQERHEETNYNLYYFSDFERHNAEIAAYHLDRVLGFRRVPPVVGRLVDVIKEIKDITTDGKLARTFFNSPVGNSCFYGQCSYYCSTEHAVCGQPQALEASLAAMLPDLSLAPRRAWRSPWRRSYSRSKLAQWETEKNYCDTVKKTPPYDQGTRLVDVIDMAVLDFLMSNMDRHHYETFEKFGNDTFLIHLDNGRAFGRFSKDEPSILAPLEQCCRIRRSTLKKLQLLCSPQLRLSDVMRASLSQDPLAAVAPLLSEPHLAALDRRLAKVLEVVARCQEQHSDTVFDDIPDYPG
ncbi:extracellular serine/threonine protein kinase FAM20C [Engraulis encrasicolus]|uniref:extracellular serine/threonine protein kinase FAM20C n=1 Tax=Engraulis encrasicolus TaxID=184585 RepID=UPI002FD4FB05